MKDLTPRNIALLISALSVLVFASTFAFLHFFISPSYSWLLLFLGAAGIFIITYIAGLYVIEKFIYKKIKVIYKTIHSLKLNKDSFPQSVSMYKDILSQVNQDVLDWAKNNKEEIEYLKSQEQYRKEFIGNVSHELKTPIFNIQGYLLTLLEGGLEDQTINRDYLMRAERSVERMIAIVEDLDIVTRLESGQLEMEFLKFDILELVKDVFDSQEMKARQKQIRFKIRKNKDNPIYVFADKDRIRQVLTNLIVNSVKYGKQEGTTEVRFYDMEENILIEVADNGVGISKTDLLRVFERFYRVDKSRSRAFGGSGLGLAIVKHIIEAHEQTINVRSTEGIGSTFSFTLKKAA